MTRQQRIAYLESQISNAKGAAENLLLQAEAFQVQLNYEKKKASTEAMDKFK